MRARFILLSMAIGLLSGAAWWWFSAGPSHLQINTLSAALTSRPDIDASRPAGEHGAPVSYNSAVLRAAPSVVSVYASTIPDDTDSPNPLPQRVRTTQGSGVVIDADGLVVTNLHIVADADTINVALQDGRLYPALLMGSDEETDIAVLHIPRTGLPALALEAAAPLVVGDVVLAIGNPFGVGQTVTQGIVSAVRRRIAGASPWQNFVQIDAAINPGNSGGALINPAGQLVGVNTAVFRRLGDYTGSSDVAFAEDAAAQGIGFAIPAGLLAEIVPKLVEEGRVARGWLGATAEDLPLFPRLASQLGTAAGAVITATVPGGPAERSGLLVRDVVTSLEGTTVSTANALLLAVAACRPDTTARVELFRGGEAVTLDVLIGERPSQAGSDPANK